MKFSIFIIAVIAVGAFIFWPDVKGTALEVKQSFSTEGSKKNKKEKTGDEISAGIRVVEKWDLPAVLREVSGIAYIDNSRFACIQDEEGTIFIYNHVTNKIEKEISFAGPGDYEGLTINENMAYVVRSDGRIFEVDMNVGKTSTREFTTSLTAENNVEGLCFDETGNRLLLAIKGNETNSKEYKGIYAFDLTTKKFIAEPVIRIDLKQVNLNGKSKKNRNLNPSAIGIHPISNDYYITDGMKSGLIVMDASGNIKSVLSLGKSFAQPEGITFSPQGEIFISNEGPKQPANIVKVEIE